MSFVSHLECSLCKQNFDADKIWNLCPECGKPLLVRYNLDDIRGSVDRDAVSHRNPDMWRYHEMLPVKELRFRMTLGEGFTPMIHANRLGDELEFEKLFVKEEGVNPTGSFKARGLSVAVSRALELGIGEVSIPSAGNAAGAMSAYAALAGIKANVFMPKDVPEPFVSECRAFGAEITLVDGLITDCGRVAADGVKKFDRFDMSTLKEPYRLEGKKTMGYEVAEQMDWTLPDVIIYPTGGGTGLVGMWKAFSEMETLGWIGSERPRMVTVQSEGCAPMVRAFDQGKEFAEVWKNASTVAAGLCVPAAIGDFLILKALRESNGIAVAVSDKEIMYGAKLLGHTQGIFACPEGGATVAAFQHLRAQGWILRHETVLLFNTGSGYKYAHLWK
jgi:threonine synthase